ncbi:MAG: hypothetical protein FJ247_14150 [Nitrospira sp.]|nr:hypothetical protein [Nitrospira sp.]
MIAFVEPWVDPDQLSAYRYSQPWPGDVTQHIAGPSSKDRLKAFVAKYLQSRSDAMVVCENSDNIRKTADYWSWGTIPPISCYGEEEIYHVLIPALAGPDIIDTSVSDAIRHWGTGVCAAGLQATAGDRIQEPFLDEVAERAKYIFMPVFDGNGILIWTPQHSGEEPTDVMGTRLLTPDS